VMPRASLAQTDLGAVPAWASAPTTSGARQHRHGAHRTRVILALVRAAPVGLVPHGRVQAVVRGTSDHAGHSSLTCRCGAPGIA
jgi:hypothetical protein